MSYTPSDHAKIDRILGAVSESRPFPVHHGGL